MTKKFKEVPVRGMTAKEVLDLWQRGKLYCEEKVERVADEELLLSCQQEALAYVAAIERNTSVEWQGLIKVLWERIVNDETFRGCLVIHKGRNTGKLNRYVVTNIVFHLQALDVYLCSNLLELHKKLEGVSEKNSIYKGAGEYKLNSMQRRRLRELREEVAGQK